jgi:ribose 1,5-bisphosphokinase
MSAGTFVCVVGPSGAGKDTLIDGASRALAGDGRFVFPRRVVTRPPPAFEDHDAMTSEAFQAAARDGAFALSWSAHGLSYGIPDTVVADLSVGRVVVCNLSRQAVPEAHRSLGMVRTILITAPRSVLRERLMARSREDSEDLEARLGRDDLPPGFDVDLRIENVGPVGQHLETLLGFLRGLAGCVGGDEAGPPLRIKA